MSSPTRVLLPGVLALLVGASPAISQTQNQTGPTPPPTRAAMPLDGTWTILDEYINEGDFFSGPWTWSSALPIRLTLTDVYVTTDQFEVYDHGRMVMRTPYRPDWDDLGYPDPFSSPPYEGDPDLALASSFFCNGSMVFGPGSHSITFRLIHVPPQADGTPFPDGTVAFKAEPALGEAFCLELYPNDDLVRFPPTNPGNETIISSTTGAFVDAFAMDFNSPATVLYGIDAYTLDFGTIDTVTGVWAPMLTVTPGWTGTLSGLTVDPTDETFYVSSTDSTTSYLYQLNPGSGALTLIGTTNIAPMIIDISADLHGELYAICMATDSLYRVNKANGAVALIGPLGFDLGFAQGMDFDFSTNTLYASMVYNNGTGFDLASIDVGTGLATVIPGQRQSELEIAFNEPSVAPAAPGFPYCFGDPGSGIPCPCNNDNDGSISGSGCHIGINPIGARLVGYGVASVSNDTLVLTTYAVEPNNWGLYFQADNQVAGGVGAWFGDGLRCAGGNLVRLQPRPADALGASWTTISISVKGGVAPGVTKRYQYWFRTQVAPPCGLGVNDFNLSNGYEITWLP